MFDKEIGEEEPSVTIPDLPYHDTSKPSQYQAYVSAYSIDGFFSSIIEVIGAHGWVKNSELPTLTTTNLNILLPGISDHYGADQPMDVYFNVTQLGDFQVFE